MHQTPEPLTFFPSTFEASFRIHTLVLAWCYNQCQLIMPFTPYVLHHKMKDSQDYIRRKKRHKSKQSRSTKNWTSCYLLKKADQQQSIRKTTP